MRSKAKSEAVIKLLKEGYSPREVTHRMAVSYNYAWKLKKDLAQEVEEEKAAKLAEVRAAAAEEAKAKEEEAKAKEEEAKAKEVEAVLDTRADQYGSFMAGAEVAIKIKAIMHNAVARNDIHMFPDQLQALDMIATKISRIVNGNPSHRDSWIDIAGYAKLVADRLQGKIR